MTSAAPANVLRRKPQVGLGRRLPALATAALPAGALVAALRTFDDLTPAGPRSLYVIGLVVWLAIGIALVRETRPRSITR